MSVKALSRHLAKLHLHAPPHHRALLRAQHLHWKNGEQEKEDETERVQQLYTYTTGGLTLPYNPAAYYRVRVERSPLMGSADSEEPSHASLNRPFRQQSNPYSISSSRRLSSAKNILLDLALNRPAGDKEARSAPYPKKDVPPDVKGEPRAFQRCRPEYGIMTHDPSQDVTPLQSKRVSLLLHKVTVLKGHMGPEEIMHFLSELSRLPVEQMPLVRGDTRFYMLLRYSVESLPLFTNMQLIEVLRSFVRLGLPHSHSVLGLYETEFSCRTSDMDLHQLLLVADLWRCLGRSVPHYLERLYNCINLHFSQMGPSELVQLIYIMGEGRRCPTPLVQPLELMLMRHLDKLQAEEVSAVCLGLFKSQTSLSEGAVRRLVDRAHAVVREMSDFGVANVMKLLRFSHLDHVAWLEAMGTEVPRRAPDMGVQGLMHVALGCSALHYRDDRILLAVAERLPDLALHCRSKDAGKLLWAYGTLGIRPSQCPELFSCLTNILRQRELEFQRYPEHLLTGLLGLAFVGQFPQDLLSFALSPEFVSQANASQELELKKDLLTLDGTVGVELPGWTGPRLSQAVKEEVIKQLWDFAQSDVCQKPEVLEAETMLQELLGGKAFVRKHMILPHLRSIDLEVHLDRHGQPLPLDSEPCQPNQSDENSSSLTQNWTHTGVTLTEDLLAQLTNTKRAPAQPSIAMFERPLLRKVEPAGEREGIISVGVDLSDGLLGALTKPMNRSSIRVPRKPDVVRLAVQVSNRNQYCYRTQQLLGLHALKRRQLELAGYKVVELPHWEWFPLLRRSRAEKLAYLHCKIFSSSDLEKQT
ncbi:FAST kinase domain-containing protein 5, mitochondrial [Chanos chanos]|uniref:FAST kinase domain-containing protein 5, mitochondrial n=1 Tax=Chanos chanos TaxID=29144 RepID=A0A6J2WC39_CHACN|nr:FAST kinase domain-containing protein 5, mitochondrial [Chanos chanos]